MNPNPPAEINWKAESQRFDAVPDAYETYRPGYPAEMIQAIIDQSGLQPDGSILEIGSGTGKATEPFARRGYTVLCVEPGQHLMAKAAHRFADFSRVSFVNTTFEDWLAPEASFDLVISGQAFHWIDKGIGFPKIHWALRANAWLAVFWNSQPPDVSPIWTEIDQVYRTQAPALYKESDSYETSLEKPKQEIEACGFFHPVALLRFPWQAAFNIDQYLGLLGTYSDHLGLDESIRARLYAGIAEVIDRHGGAIDKNYEACLYMAQKK